MRVVEVLSTKKSGLHYPLIVFEDAGETVQKGFFVSSCARACAKGVSLRNEWSYQAIRAIREAMRDFAYKRGEDPSMVVLKDFEDFPEDYSKITEFINTECE